MIKNIEIFFNTINNMINFTSLDDSPINCMHIVLFSKVGFFFNLLLILQIMGSLYKEELKPNKKQKFFYFLTFTFLVWRLTVWSEIISNEYAIYYLLVYVVFFYIIKWWVRIVKNRVDVQKFLIYSAIVIILSYALEITDEDSVQNWVGMYIPYCIIMLTGFEVFQKKTGFFRSLLYIFLIFTYIFFILYVLTTFL